MRIEITVREVRIRKQMSFEELARRARISKGTLSKIERQEQDAKFSTMIRIAIALKTDISELYKIHFWLHESVFFYFHKWKWQFHEMVSQTKPNSNYFKYRSL